MIESRFSTVVFLHDREDNPDGHVGELTRILSESHPNVRFLRPSLPTGGFLAVAAALFPLFVPNSLMVGIGSGGLFAVAMQERFPALNLSVCAINSSPEQDELAYPWTTAKAYSLGRVILYSSQYEPLRGKQPEQWSKYCDLVFDVPWLSGGVQKAFYSTSYLISTFMRGLNMAKEVASIQPPQD
jgi:hypothetical protein